MASNTTPASLTDAGLPTNGVHVIDLSVILPALFLKGIFILRKQAIGMLLAVLFLVFMFLMDVTIGGMTLVMFDHQFVDTPFVAYLMIVLGGITVLFIWQLFLAFNRAKKIPVG